MPYGLSNVALPTDRPTDTVSCGSLVARLEIKREGSGGKGVTGKRRSRKGRKKERIKDGGRKGKKGKKEFLSFFMKSNLAF